MKKTINVDTIAQELSIDRDKLQQWKKDNLSKRPSHLMSSGSKQWRVVAGQVRDPSAITAGLLCSFPKKGSRIYAASLSLK